MPGRSPALARCPSTPRSSIRVATALDDDHIGEESDDVTSEDSDNDDLSVEKQTEHKPQTPSRLPPRAHPAVKVEVIDLVSPPARRGTTALPLRSSQRTTTRL